MHYSPSRSRCYLKPSARERSTAASCPTPRCSAERTARRTDSAIASGSRRRARGRFSTVETTASNTISSIASPADILLGDADQIDLGIVDQFALVGHRDRDEGAAGEGQLAPLDHGARLGLLEDRAVLVEPARRQFVDDRRDRRGRAGPDRRCGRSAPSARRRRAPAWRARTDAAPRHAPGSAAAAAPRRSCRAVRRGADGRRRGPDGCGR